jgi:ApbE superfamily uncharacterized protein (UPF0280 family)
MPYKEERFYRYQHHSKTGWFTFQTQYRETDLWIRSREDVRQEALTAVLNYRRQLEHYIAHSPSFLTSLVPLPEDPFAPPLVRRMMEASRTAGVGPMAGVAGAMAQFVAQDLKVLTPAVIIENGGDCYLDIQEEMTVGIYAGPDSPFNGRMALRFPAARFPLGICTSSGTVGHSLSFGKADAVTVVAKDAALADATATALGNLVQSADTIQKALERAAQVPSIEGVLVIVKDKMGIWGDLELMPLQDAPTTRSGNI